jgi:serine/threonine protein kinase
LQGDEKVEYLGPKSVRPWKWSAPENFQYPQYCIQDGPIICPKPIYTSKSDVWSYGVTLWEISTSGDEPYDDQNDVDVISKIFDENYRLGIPASAHPRLNELMKQCWLFDLPKWNNKGRLVHQLQESRPSFDEIWNAYFLVV